jgi:hypothetical protein
MVCLLLGSVLLNFDGYVTIFKIILFKLSNFSSDEFNSSPSDLTVSQTSLISRTFIFYSATAHSGPIKGKGKGKGKVYPNTCHEVPEGE